jgi:hypothetical protein
VAQFGNEQVRNQELGGSIPRGPTTYEHGPFPGGTGRLEFGLSHSVPAPRIAGDRSVLLSLPAGP